MLSVQSSVIRLALLCVLVCSVSLGCSQAPLESPPLAPITQADGADGEQSTTEPVLGYPPVPGLTPPTADVDDPEVSEPGFIPPTILSVEPAEGDAAGGDVVTIHGADFQQGVDVYFGDVKAPLVFFIDSEWLNATTPPGNPGLVDVRVANPDGEEAVIADAFRYTAELEVHSVSPGSGHPMGGDPVTVYGAGFEPGDQVLFGDKLAFEVLVISGNELTCVTPPGASGWVDVRVLVEGGLIGHLDNAFQYVAPPEVKSLWPPHGPTTGGTEVQLSGQFLSADMTVTLGQKTVAPVWVSKDGKQATIKTPGGSAGAVDLTLSGAAGFTTLEDAFTYLSPTVTALTLWNVVPSSGSAVGGYQAMLVVQGLDKSQEAEVTFGGAKATVTQLGTYPNTVFVDVPPGTTGAVSVAIAQGGAFSQLDDAFVYTAPLGITNVQPASGPTSGGQQLTLTGVGFESVPGNEVVVYLGALASPSVDVSSDGTLMFEAPPCTPGLLDVVIQAGDQTATLAGAFECRDNTVRILAVDPPMASQAGGGLVQVIGTGLPYDAVSGANTTFSFNGELATDIEWGSTTSAWMRVPRGDAGPAVVSLKSPLLGGETLQLSDGFLYFDSANKKAATWGPHIERTVNISVFNGSNGKRLEGATAILGSDPLTPYQCVTDDRGQCVVSFHELSGAQQVTANRPIFSAYTISGFNATNVTVFIRPQAPPAYQGPPGSPGPPPQIDWNELTGSVSGKVLNIGKYVMPPPSDCALLGTPDGFQCIPCVDDSTCQGSTQCLPMGDTGAWCVAPCATDGDCSLGFKCANLGSDGPKCVPHSGTIRAECATSTRYFFGSNPNPGPGALVSVADSTYTIQARLGEVTVYCMAGYDHPINGLFIPTAMGIHEHVFVTQEKPIVDIDVTINIPLHQTLHTRVHGLPTHEDGTTEPDFVHKLDIGAEGWIPFNVTPSKIDGELYEFAGYPESTVPFGPDAIYTFYSRLRAKSTTYAPWSYYFNHKIPDINGEPIRTLGDPALGWEMPGSGVRGHLNGVWGSDADNVFAVGPKGRIVHKNAFGWAGQPGVTFQNLNAVWGDSATSIWVAGDGGVVLHFDGVSWQVAPVIPAVQWNINDVHGEWLVGDGGILRNLSGGIVMQPVLHSKGLKAVLSLDGGKAIAVGTQGKILRFDGSNWSATMVGLDGDVPSPALNAIWTDAIGTIWIVGEAGTVIRVEADGSWFQEETSTGTKDLYAVSGDGTGTLYAAGAAGTLIMRSPGENWVSVSEPTFSGLEVRDFWRGDGQVLAVGSHRLNIGPFMAFPLPIQPAHLQFLAGDHVTWDFRNEGPEPVYNHLYINASDGYQVWTVVADGHLSHVSLPPLMEVTGYNPLNVGQKYFTLYRNLNPTFSIDGYRFKHLSIWRRTTWSRAYGLVY
jgi:hypothetical protein